MHWRVCCRGFEPAAGGLRSPSALSRLELLPTAGVQQRHGADARQRVSSTPPAGSRAPSASPSARTTCRSARRESCCVRRDGLRRLAPMRCSRTQGSRIVRHVYCQGESVSNQFSTSVIDLDALQKQEKQEMSLIHISRCRRDAVCRSPGAPYH